jgi:hypothetical protein
VIMVVSSSMSYWFLGFTGVDLGGWQVANIMACM